MKNPKKTLICLHGFTHNGRFFEKLAEKLTQYGWLVICPTFLGRGNQENDEPSKYNYETYVEYLEDITKDFSNFSLLGSSMGGLIAMFYADKNPKKIDRLILNDVGDFIDRNAIAEVGKFITKQTDFSSQTDLNKRIEQEFLESHIDDKELKFLKDIYTENNQLKYDPNLSLAFWKGDKQRKIPDFDYREVWQRIVENNKTMETLIIRGSISNFLTKQTALSMQKNQTIQLKEVENVGHLPLFFKQDEIKLITDFLGA